MIKKCKICGKEFEARTSEAYCSGPHFRVCDCCGKEFEIIPAQINRTSCSKECMIKLANRKREETRKAKAAQNIDINVAKGGRYERTCSICGETFHTASKTRKLCYKPHTRNCCICGASFDLNVYASNTQTCSSKCAAELRTRRNLEKYGVRSTLELESTKEKIKQTCLDRYGVENPMQSSEIQNRLRKTNQEKYGVDWSVQREDVKAKSQETCLDRYGVRWGCTSDVAKQKTVQTNLERRGVEHVFQDPEFQANARQSCLERYGTEHYVQSDDFKSKAQATWIEKYGVDNPFKSEEIQRRAIETNYMKYGTRRPQQNLDVHTRIMESYVQNRANSLPEEARIEYLKFKHDPVSYVKDALSQKLTPTTIANMVGYQDSSLVFNIIHDNNLENLASFCMPQMEQDISRFLQSIRSDIRILHHDRHTISPYELDLYLPDYNLAIECNPTATHNSTISFGEWIGIGSTEPMKPNYHKMKTDLCEQKGIFLFHIFGYEWAAKSEIIKSMLRNLISGNTDKYFARKLCIKEVSYSDSLEFLNANHRQGFAVSSVNLGLYTSSNELVSLMTFGKTRGSMGRQPTDNDDTWELIRFCNKLNTSVVGGASRLFYYFRNNWNASKIVSFSDRAHTKGNLYKMLGFDLSSYTDANYVWVNMTTDLYFNRVTCQKHKLPKLFNDPGLDIEHKTEKQIMLEHGFVQVFDSGNIRWEYTNR